jgi:hypothetical protein
LVIPPRNATAAAAGNGSLTIEADPTVIDATQVG